MATEGKKEHVVTKEEETHENIQLIGSAVNPIEFENILGKGEEKK